ncbi:MAG TPA: hypothetical protein VLH79_00375 [Chthonomonadales bacterium]|nr:hypothetical protein [Chthonomonadales bacterium]
MPSRLIPLTRTTGLTDGPFPLGQDWLNHACAEAVLGAPGGVIDGVELEAARWTVGVPYHHERLGRR